MDSLRLALSTDPQAPQQVVSEYRALLEKYPTSGALWSAYAQYLYRMHLIEDLEKAFASSLRSVLDIRLWRIYLQHVVSVNKFGSPETTSVLIQAFEFSVNTIGLDVYSAPIWSEYIEVIQSPNLTPGIDPITRSDAVRKIYTRALSIPLEGLESLWQSYDAFEQNVNKVNAKKMIADRSLAYMTARTQVKTLIELSVEGVDRDALAEPLIGPPSVSDSARMASWLRWIQWERSNPLQAEKQVVASRTMFAFRKALMYLRYHPEAWLGMVNFCDELKSSEESSIAILKQAIEYNPCSLSLSLSLAERYELDKKVSEAKSVFEVLISNLEAKASALSENLDTADGLRNASGNAKFWIEKTSLGYINYMAFCRRTEGIPTARTVFTRARKFPLVRPQVYVASALMEFHSRKDSAVAAKIFELGMAKFGSWSVEYVLEYVKLLQAINDDANIRSLFERAVNQLGTEKSKPVWLAYLEYESHWGGDLSSLKALERRYSELFPATNSIINDLFEKRFSFRSLEPIDDKASLAMVSDTALDSRSLLSQSGGKSVLSIPGVFPDSLILLLGRIPSYDVYDGPTIPIDQLVSLLKNYQQKREASLQNNPHSYTNTYSSYSHKDDQRDGSRDGYGHRDRNREAENRRSGSSYIKSSSSSKRSSTYSDIFEDKRRRRK